MVTTFDPFGALMISHNNGIYLSSFCVVYLYIASASTFRFIIIVYYWIIITGYCKHEFGTKNMLYSLKRLSYYTPTPPHNSHFLLSPRFPFDCTCISLSFSDFFCSFSIRTTSSNPLTASGSMEVCIYCT